MAYFSFWMSTTLFSQLSASWQISVFNPVFSNAAWLIKSHIYIWPKNDVVSGCVRIYSTTGNFTTTNMCLSI